MMTKRYFTRYAAALMAALALSGPALAQNDICPLPEVLELNGDDISRLENLGTSRIIGLGSAMRSEYAADRAVVAELFEPGIAPVDPELLAGDYRCRTIKMGGILPLVVYQWFRCEIRETEEGWTIDKVTGSQNFSGILIPGEGTGVVYRGASTYGYEDASRAYGDDPEHDQVGCLSAVTKGNRHFMLELPFPRLESYHDVIELRP
jgi:hypothetical protein